MKDEDRGFENKALSALSELFGRPPVPPDARPASPPKEPPPPAGTLGEPIVRRERKQRRGKTVTRVSRLGLDAAGLPALARELAKALGCGAKVEGEDIVLQGDQIERSAAWLER